MKGLKWLAVLGMAWSVAALAAKSPLPQSGNYFERRPDGSVHCESLVSFPSEGAFRIDDEYCTMSYRAKNSESFKPVMISEFACVDFGPSGGIFGPFGKASSTSVTYLGDSVFGYDEAGVLVSQNRIYFPKARLKLDTRGICPLVPQ